MSAAQQLVPTSGDKYDQREMVDTIKQTVCKGATDAQLRMFIEVCRATGLNPFLKELWYVPEKGIIMAGRDGYLRVANEHPQFDGMETRVERDERGLPIKATCSVWRKDRSHPMVCEAYYDEYKKSSPVWQTYKSAMISKVAEVLALKRSFSINGVVTEEEIGNDGSGSREAAASVAEAKIAALKAGVSASAVAEVLPPEEMTLEEQLAASIQQAETKKRKKAPGHYEMLQAFGELKKRYTAIGCEATYYLVLERHGAKHSNEFPDTEEGRSKARICYKTMSLNVAELEAQAKQAKPELVKKRAVVDYEGDWPTDPPLDGPFRWNGDLYEFSEDAGNFHKIEGKEVSAKA